MGGALAQDQEFPRFSFLTTIFLDASIFQRKLISEPLILQHTRHAVDE